MVVLGSLEKEDDWWQFHFHRDDRKRIETDQMYGMWEKAKEMINGENDDKIERKEMMSMAETFDWRKEMELHVGTPYIRDPLIGEHQKRKWTIDPYKSPAFLDMLRVNGMTLDDFRKTDLYGSAVQDGLIVNDEWVGPNDIGGW